VTRGLKEKLDNGFRHCRKKDRLAIDNTCLSLKMLPKFYQTHLRSVLNANQYILLNVLVELLQGQKQVRLERLAANLPLPIQFESRRRQLQRLRRELCRTVFKLPKISGFSSLVCNHKLLADVLLFN
jgi:hypothetical protein